jgi:UDP-N-acetylglucosamine 2-epimerase (non-hydrolysing)
VETVQGGFNHLVGLDPARVREALRNLSMPADRPTPYGDGQAAEHIADALAAWARP